MKIILQLIMFSQLVACVSVPEKKAQLNKRYVIETVEENLPPNLWSPEKRTAMSYYHYLVADLATMRGELNHAEQNYDASYALRPNAFTGAKLVTSHAMNGHTNDSLAESRRMVLLYPKSASLRVLYGRALFQNNDKNAAAEEFEKAIGLDPLNESAYTAAIAVYVSIKDYKKALENAVKYKTFLPSSAEARLWEAKILLNMKDHKSALVAIEAAYEMQSSNPNILLVYAYTLEMNKSSKAAITFYERLFRLAPNSLELAGKLVDLYKQLGSLSEAFDVLDGISNRLNETQIPVELQKIFILWELKKFDDAVEIAENLMTEYSSVDHIKYVLGYSFLMAERDQDALEPLLAVSSQSQFRGHAVIYASDVLRRLKRDSEAYPLLEEFKTLKEPKSEYFRYASEFYIREKNYTKALEFLEIGYENFPKTYTFLFLKGVYQEKLGNVDAAVSTMKKLIGLVPDHAGALNFVGYVYAEQNKNLDEAKDYLLRAIKKEPTNGFYLDSLGWIYYRLNQLDLAEAELNKALKYEPQEGVIYEHLGEVEVKKGNIEKAIDYFEKALLVRLSESDKKRVETRLQQIRQIGSE